MSTLDAQHLARRHPGDSVRGRSHRLVMQPGDLGFWGRLGTHECRASPGLTRPAVWKVKKCERFSLGNTYGTFCTRPGNRHALSSELPPGARAGAGPTAGTGPPSLADGRGTSRPGRILNGLSLGPDGKGRCLQGCRPAAGRGPAHILCRR